MYNLNTNSSHILQNEVDSFTSKYISFDKEAQIKPKRAGTKEKMIGFMTPHVSSFLPPPKSQWAVISRPGVISSPN